MCNMGGSCNPKSEFKKDEREACRNCEYIGYDKSVHEMKCAINIIKKTKNAVYRSLPPLRICSAYDRNPKE